MYYYNLILLLFINSLLSGVTAAAQENDVSNTPVVQKRKIDIAASLPHVNNFYLQPENETAKSSTGFLGIALGIDYTYKQNRF